MVGVLGGRRGPAGDDGQRSALPCSTRRIRSDLSVQLRRQASGRRRTPRHR